MTAVVVGLAASLIAWTRWPVSVPQPLVRFSIPLPPGSYRSPRVSPDGRFVTFDTDGGRESNVWIYALDGKSRIRQLTFGGRNQYPIWSDDGQFVVFQSDREGDRGIFRQRADGASHSPPFPA